MDSENKQGIPRGPIPMPAPAPQPGQLMSIPPDKLALVAFLLDNPPGAIQIMIGDVMVGEKMTPASVHNLLGELRTRIRKYAAEKGNVALADGL